MRHSQEESVKLFFKKTVIFASQIQLRSLGVCQPLGTVHCNFQKAFDDALVQKSVGLKRT